MGPRAAAVAAAALPVAAAASLDVRLSPTDANLSVHVGGASWFTAGPVAIRSAAEWWMKDCAASAAPKCSAFDAAATAAASASGTDAVGAFDETTVTFATAGADPVRFVAGLRTYAAAPDVAVLVQRFPDGLTPGNNEGKVDEIVSAFPSLSAPAVDLGVVYYDGTQLQGTRHFAWPRGAAFAPTAPPKRGKGSGDGAGMPLVLHDEGLNTLVVSPLDDFFTACQVASHQMGGALTFGMQGTLTSAPAGHEHLTLLVAGEGVGATMLRWGELLRRAAGGGKERSMQWTRSGDAGLRTLSYYTDNGAYYYYHTVNGSCCCPKCKSKNNPATPQGATGYAATLDAIAARLQDLRVPVGVLQLDSWWYYKGSNDGVKLWEPMPSTLGGSAVHDPPSAWWPVPNGWALVTHSRWYEADNEYVTGDAPGSNTSWRWIKDKGISISTDVAFFRHIFARAKQWGMATYEQDFLVTQYEKSPTLQGVVGAGRQWLGAMAAAAEAENVTIQYCMSLPRHILQSASFPRVTQARASHDYGQSRADDTEQWSSIGLTAMLYWSLGLLPYKDPFWSEVDESGNPWGGGARELDPELQALVSALTAGPVGVGDGVDYINVTRVMQTCRADGTLLKPDRPAWQLDSTFARALGGGAAGQDAGVPHVWRTTASPGAGAAGGARHLLLAANLTRPYTVAASELGAGEGAVFVAREYYSGELRWVDAQRPLVMATQRRPAGCVGEHDYCTPFAYWSITPVPSATDVVVLGEVDKFIPVSPQRFGSLSGGAAAVSGQRGERVTLALVDCRAAGTCDVAASPPPETRVACAIGSSGTAALKCPASGACVCE